MCCVGNFFCHLSCVFSVAGLQEVLLHQGEDTREEGVEGTDETGCLLTSVNSATLIGTHATASYAWQAAAMFWFISLSCWCLQFVNDEENSVEPTPQSLRVAAYESPLDFRSPMVGNRMD
jgi:hypothetical protein